MAQINPMYKTNWNLHFETIKEVICNLRFPAEFFLFHEKSFKLLAGTIARTVVHRHLKWCEVMGGHMICLDAANRKCIFHQQQLMIELIWFNLIRTDIYVKDAKQIKSSSRRHPKRLPERVKHYLSIAIEIESKCFENTNLKILVSQVLWKRVPCRWSCNKEPTWSNCSCFFSWKKSMNRRGNNYWKCWNIYEHN